ncbi:MAG TPA: glycosyltransferase [Lachnospiraceae bacterium]|nr:glycosyltransferase [Lachnospiraceae bacterium]
MLVSVVIPCYNSEHTIDKVVDSCMEEFARWDGYECEMILVNDYSKDGTFRTIQRMAAKYPNVTGISLARNFGQHAAIMAGLAYVHGDYVVGMDDDMQNHPSQIKQFLDKAKEGYDVIFGIYKKRKFSFWKNLTSKIGTSLMNHLLDGPEGIERSNFWLARRYVIDEVKKYDGCDPFIQLLFFRTTHNMANIVIDHYEREVGSSNYTFRKGLKLFMSIVSYSTIPLRISTYFGIVFSLVGFVSALVVLIRKLIDPTIAVGWSSLMCTYLLLAGFLFLMLGIIGEYIGKIILNGSKTPQYVIRNTVHGDKTESAENSETSAAAGPRGDKYKITSDSKTSK